MKKSVIKSFCLAVLQLLIVCLLWPTVLVERALTWCLWRLGAFGLCCPARSALGDLVARRESGKDTRADFDVVWACLENSGDNFLAAFRLEVETQWGIPEWAQKDNPRLYANLVPTREENLERISYSLCNVPSDHLEHWLAEVAAALG